MKAMNMIRARVGACKRRWWSRNRYRLHCVYGAGETVVFDVKIKSTHPSFGDEVLLCDAEGKTTINQRTPRRIYLDFEQHGLVPSGDYAVFINGVAGSYRDTPDYECLSHMVDDWFTTSDEMGLTLLSIEHGQSCQVERWAIARV